MLRSGRASGREPDNRSASLAPAAGQNRAETTANTSKANRVSSPPVSPNMRRRVAQDALDREVLLPRQRARAHARARNSRSSAPESACGFDPNEYWGAMSGDVRRSYVVGLGANLGERLATLKSAVLALQAHGEVQAVSHLYETAAVGPPQPDYLNAAVRLESSLAPQGLLRELLSIERAHGRERRERWGPRTLDLDLLYSPSLLLNEADLTLPHPELRRRAFALAPLMDVAPGAVDPRSGERYADLLAALGPQDLRRLETSLSWDPRPNRSVAPGRAE